MLSAEPSHRRVFENVEVCDSPHLPISKPAESSRPFEHGEVLIYLSYVKIYRIQHIGKRCEFSHWKDTPQDPVA